jgi:hypothetical protein
MGQVQGFKYLHNRFLRRMDRCVLIVAFDCQGRTYKQKTLNTAKAFKYRKGDEVELLYHPTYKKHIVIRTEGVSGPREFGYL